MSERGAHRPFGAIALAVAMVFAAVAVGGAGLAVADEHEDEPPGLTASYFGAVTVDGEPAPEGTVVTAVVDGEERASIALEEAGQYGSGTVEEPASPIDVPGSPDDGNVTFLVNGEEAETDPSTVDWEEGVHEVDLTAEDVGEPPFFAVDIDGDGSTTSVDPNETATVVADIENTGDAIGEQPVQFTVNETVEETIDDVELDGGDTETVEFDTELEGETTVEATVSTLDDESTVTLTSEPEPAPGPGLPPEEPEPEPGEPAIEVIDATFSQETVAPGETVEVTATLQNLGADGTETVELSVDGTAEADETVTVGAGEITDVSFKLTLDAAGTYDISVEEVDIGTLTVAKPAEFTVSDLDVDATEIDVGDSVTATATVENVGDQSGTATVELFVDGEAVDSQTVTLDGGEATTVEFTETFETEAEYELAIGDTDSVTITVGEPADDAVPGFGVTVVIAALTVAIAIGLRRR